MPGHDVVAIVAMNGIRISFILAKRPLGLVKNNSSLANARPFERAFRNQAEAVDQKPAASPERKGDDEE